MRRILSLILLCASMALAALSSSNAKFSPVYSSSGLREENIIDMYEYGAATVYHNGMFYRFYCSRGGTNAVWYMAEHPDRAALADKETGAWDFVRMKTSRDGAVWSAPRVVLTPTIANREKCACDPAIIHDGGFWYLFYTGHNDKQHTVTYVARSKNIEGPYLRYTTDGKWLQYPQNPGIVLSTQSAKGRVDSLNAYGTGQASVVKIGHTYHFWFTDVAESVVNASADRKWAFVHIKVDAPNGELDTVLPSLQSEKRDTIKLGNESELLINDFGDVKWNPNKGRFEMWITSGHFKYVESGLVKILKYTSKDGINWTKENAQNGEMGPFNFANNVGMSGNGSGWIVQNKTLVSFGAPIKGLHWDAAIAERERKKYVEGIDGAEPKEGNPGIPWALYQFIDNTNGGVFWVSKNEININGDTKGVNYFKFPKKSSRMEFVAGDFDGDGITDIGAVDKDSAQWYIRSSLTGNFGAGKIFWGWKWPGLDYISDDFKIVVGDFDGDGRTDPAIVHKPSMRWFIYSSKNGEEAVSRMIDEKKTYIWGETILGLSKINHVLTGDYDGDGINDIGGVDCFDNASPSYCVWRFLSSKEGRVKNVKTTYPDNGVHVWHGMNSKFDVLEGDYDGDGKTDATIFNKYTGEWFSISSRALEYDPVFDYDRFISNVSNGYVFAMPHIGWTSSSTPVVGDFNGDGITDRSLVRSSYDWNAAATDYPHPYFDSGEGFDLVYFNRLPLKSNYQFLVGDYDGDGVSDCVIADPTESKFYFYTSSSKNGSISKSFYHMYEPGTLIPLFKSYSNFSIPAVDQENVQFVPKTLARFSVQSLVLTISDMNLGSEIGVFNMIGQKIFNSVAGSSIAKIQLPSKGRYIVRVGSQSSVINVK